MAPSFQLVMKSGPTPGKVFDLAKDELVIGRDTGSDITISDAEVSRKHARIYAQGGTYVIEDLGSTNGTFVNGQRLMGPHALKSNELIMFGENVGLVFEASAVDMDATIAAGPGQMPGLPPPPIKAPMPEPAAPRPSSVVTDELRSPAVEYVGQIPEGPEDDASGEIETEQKSNTRTWILAGCGCLLILCCVVIGGAYAFDSMNLYCQSPFDTIFGAFGYCP